MLTPHIAVAPLASLGSLDCQETLPSWEIEVSLLNAHRAGVMRVRMIQTGAVALTSPTSIQPESRVTTIGATSEGLFAGRA